MNQKVLDTLAEECPCRGDWCFLRDALQHRKNDDSTLTQMRMMIDFRYLYGKWNKKSPTDREALDDYVKRGYVQKFFKIWKEDMTHEEIFYKMFGEDSTDKSQPEEAPTNISEDSKRDPTAVVNAIWQPNIMDQKLLEDLMSECPCNGRIWCFFKEAVQHTGLSDRSIAQMRMMIDFENLYRKLNNPSCTRGEAYMEWINRGYAKKFEEVWPKDPTKKGNSDELIHEKLAYKMFIEKTPAIVRLAE